MIWKKNFLIYVSCNNLESFKALLGSISYLKSVLNWLKRSKICNFHLEQHLFIYFYFRPR